MKIVTARRAAIGLLGILLLLLLLPSPFRPHYDIVGKPAPEFELHALGGNRVVASKDTLGKVVLVELVATWCIPCEADLEAAEKVSQRVEGSVVVGIDTSDDARDAEAWLAKHPVSFPLLFDDGNKVARKFSAFEVPTQIVISPAGIVTAVHEGPSDPKELEAWMRKAR